MLGFLSSSDNGIVEKNNVSFIHIISSTKKSIRFEVQPLALDFARALNVKKIFLFYGKEKITYDFDD